MYKISRKIGALVALMIAFIALPLSGAQDMPEVVITSPEDNATLSAGNVTVDVMVTGFNVVPKQGEPAVPGEGHIHYFIDVMVPTAEGMPAVTAEGTYVHTVDLNHTWENVTPGMHNLSVELVNNDHTPLVPPVFTMVNVTVEEDGMMTAMNGDEDEEMSGDMDDGTASDDMTSENVTIDIVAEDFAFDMDTITVPAGANVTVNFTNNDDGVPHNVAFYDSADMDVTFYKGEVFDGVETMTYSFTAPEEPGEYYFQCDIHPRMNGRFIVQ